MSGNPTDTPQQPGPHAPENKRDNLPYMDAFKGREVYTKFTDPCEGASKASLECMERNGHNRDACLEYFRAYRECKNAWIKQRRDDRRAGKPGFV